MMMMMRFRLRLMIALVSAIFAACGSSGQRNPAAPTPETTVKAITVTQGTVAGPAFQMTATARFTDGTSQDVTQSATWKISDASLATVSSTGLVTVRATGEVDVLATFQNVIGSLHLTVSLPKSFALTGVVRELAPNARPLSGVRVQLVGGLAFHTFTDNVGAFILSGLTAGRYLVEFSKDGYEIDERDFTIVVPIYT